VRELERDELGAAMLAAAHQVQDAHPVHRAMLPSMPAHVEEERPTA
jgi:hypothetical protein